MGKNQRKHKKFIRQLIYILIGLSAFVAVFLYARNLELQSTHLFVKFKGADNKLSDEFKLEIAANDNDRAKGLMYRKEMLEHEGMIFVYNKPEKQVFWMKNTLLPLDMLFLDENMKVLGILKNVPAMNTDQRSIDKPSQYVIEFNAGVSDRHGIKEGSILVTDGKIPKSKD